MHGAHGIPAQLDTMNDHASTIRPDLEGLTHGNGSAEDIRGQAPCGAAHEARGREENDQRSVTFVVMSEPGGRDPIAR